MGNRSSSWASIGVLLMPLSLAWAEGEKPTDPAAAGASSSGPATAQVKRSANFSVTVNRDGRQIDIVRDDEGISVSFPNEDGGRVTVRTKDEDELRKHPEAFELYQRYLGGERPRVRIWSRHAPGDGELPRWLEAWRAPGGAGPSWRFELREEVMPQLRERLDEIRRHADEVFRESRELREWARELAERARAEIGALRENTPEQTPSTSTTLGVIPAPPNPALRAHLGEGVLVERVLPATRAGKMGLQRYDLIRAVNGQPVRSTDELRQRLAESGSGPLTLEIVRGGQVMQLREDPVANPPTKPTG